MLRFDEQFTEALVYEWTRDPVPRFTVSKSLLRSRSLVAETHATSKRDAVSLPSTPRKTATYTFFQWGVRGNDSDFLKASVAFFQ